MRSESDKTRIESLLLALGKTVRSRGTAFLSGGACAVLYGWRERCIFIGQYGNMTYYHCDFDAQALAKIERNHSHDARDVQAMLQLQLVKKDKLWQCFDSIIPELIRFPALNEERFRAKMQAAIGAPP